MLTLNRQATHAPGPWAVEPGDSGDVSVGLAPTPTPVFANVPNDDRFRFVEIAVVNEPIYDNDENGEPLQWGGASANARLIAAAPELRDLLSLIVCTMGDCERHGLTGPLSSGDALLSLAPEIRALLARIDGQEDR